MLIAVGAGLAFTLGNSQRTRRIRESERQEQQLAESALRWSERRYRTLIENSSDIISLLDASGTILYKSPSIKRVLGFNPEELVGHRAFEMAHPDDREKLANWFVTLLREPHKPLLGEFRHINKKGAWRWMEGVASNMLSDPAVEAIVFNFRDITERKEAEQHLQRAEAALRTYADELEERVALRTSRLQESLRSLEGVLYHVAHDLRAPLRAIQGYTSLLLEHCETLDSIALEHGEKISTAVTRMDKLIQDLLEYGRLGHMDLPPRMVKLESTIAVVLGRMAEEIARNHAVIDVAEPLPSVWVHPRTLEQVLGNILDNALKFVAPRVQPRVRIWTEKTDGNVRLFIEDNGIGILPGFERKIFRVFERLHANDTYSGTGIGLAIVQKAVERMGGSVGVESQPARGSRFWIELPAGPTKI